MPVLNFFQNPGHVNYDLIVTKKIALFCNGLTIIIFYETLFNHNLIVIDFKSSAIVRFTHS